MKIFVFSIFSSLLLFSCFPFLIAPIAEHKSIFHSVEFEKTGCLGKCKAYRIQIDRKGNASFEGLVNTLLSGKYSRKLSRRENKSLWKLIDSMSLDTLKTEYDYGAEDTQQKFLRFHSPYSLIKEIRFGHDVPEILKIIDAEIEKIVAAPGWEKAKK